MTTLESYLDEINEFLIDHPQVAGFQFVTERILATSTYIRVPVALLDRSLLYFTEYRETDVDGELQLLTYTYQWMKADNTLLKRWDNARHYPYLPGFPYHVHDGDDKNILPGEPMNLLKALDHIAAQLEQRPS